VTAPGSMHTRVCIQPVPFSSALPPSLAGANQNDSFILKQVRSHRNAEHIFLSCAGGAASSFLIIRCKKERSLCLLGTVRSTNLGARRDGVSSLRPLMLDMTLKILFTVAVTPVTRSILMHLLRTGAKLLWARIAIPSHGHLTAC
jgi:hypothetical protein